MATGGFFSDNDNGGAFGSGDSNSTMAPSHVSSVCSRTSIDDNDEDLDGDGLPLAQDTTALSLAFVSLLGNGTAPPMQHFSGGEVSLGPSMLYILFLPSVFLLSHYHFPFLFFPE
ncbi:uncharacterized protein LOC110265865 isoform X2 [Arachis ipaensis]|uniref:uncharacterized protein LOC110265865 isoform X1 n=1 Tax=Arachis ipaensis TaxID=130454 RepID=UPI000A2B7E29|nr:uncharacterized protein LOC110265865 isoform X1 [Arachis ipaensis]XP_020964960.1 uncharacterized protein LOC110265865 isoform X2 [Arachis ipaensis]